MVKTTPATRHMDVNDIATVVKTVKDIQAIVTPSPPIPNQWIPVAAAIGGAFIGGFLPLCTSLVTERSKRFHEEKLVANALAAEVAALMSIVKARRYIEKLSNIAAYMSSRPDEHHQVLIQIPAHYSRVFQSYVSRLGSLKPELAANLIHFHQRIDAVVQDFLPEGLASRGEATGEMLAEDARLLQEAMTVGEKVLLHVGLSVDVIAIDLNPMSLPSASEPSSITEAPNQLVIADTPESPFAQNGAGERTTLAGPGPK